MSETKAGVLYRVHRRTGEYFAVYDPASGRLWTERSEPAARSQAQDLGLALGTVQSIRHDELMRLLGRDAPSARPRPRDATGQSAADSRDQAPATQRPIRSSAPFVRESDPQVMVSKSENAPASAFASGEPVTEPQSADDPAPDDVLESRGKLPKGIARNPFADKPNRPRRN